MYVDELVWQMQVLEERHSLLAMPPNDLVTRKVEPHDECKSVSSAMEEVHHKCTSMEQLAMLKERVLQLALTTLTVSIECFKTRQTFMRQF